MGKKSKGGGYDAEEAPVAAAEEEAEEEEEEEEGEAKKDSAVDEVDEDDWKDYIKKTAEKLSAGNDDIKEAVADFLKKKGKKASEDKVVKSKFEPFETDDGIITIKIKVGKEDDTYIVKTTVIKEAAEEAGDDDEAAKPAAPKQPSGPLVVEFRPHTDNPPMEKAVEVLYCPNCELPPDFCQYGPSWDKCKPWCIKNCPEYYPELCGVDLKEAEQRAAEASDKAKTKILPGGKNKRESSPSVSIKKLSRGGRKCVTSISGLETFGVKLEEAAKLFKKKFACGSAVVKGDNGADTVDIQGDFEDEATEIILKEYPNVNPEKIFSVEGGTKKKGKGTRDK